MAMTLRLTDDEHRDLQALAAAEGISLHDAVRKAVREAAARREHRDRVLSVGRTVIEQHAELLDRLAQ